jgi:hypothetical protein
MSKNIVNKNDYLFLVFYYIFNLMIAAYKEASLYDVDLVSLK